MKSDDLLAKFRLEVDDREDPPLWTDEEIFEYMDDAQKEFCRQTEGIEDVFTPAVCTLSLVPTTEWLPKSPLILKVRDASRNDNGRHVPVITAEDLHKKGITWRDGYTSSVSALVDGMRKGYFRVYPVCNETVDIQLSVFRLPLKDITDGGQSFEIDQQHHVHLMKWMKYRAYSKHDADTFDPRGAALGEQEFVAYCFKSKKEQERARRQVGVTAYGGI